MRNPGRAGLAADRLGDPARWTQNLTAGNDSDDDESAKGVIELTPLSLNYA